MSAVKSEIIFLLRKRVIVPSKFRSNGERVTDNLPDNGSYKNPLVVGVRQLKDWDEAPTINQGLIELGHNTGNMMFTESLLRVVKGCKWGSFALMASELEAHDCIVLAAANWVNSYDDFGWLAERLEKTKLPIILVGVGAQSSTDMELPQLKSGTLRFLRLVQERSVSIAARGLFSCEVLSHYGIKDTIPAGCPSLMLVGPGGPTLKIPERVSFDSCCIHATRHSYYKADPFQQHLYSQALAHDIDIILQSELADIYFAMGSNNIDELEDRAVDAMRDAYGSEDVAHIQSYLMRHGHAFANYEDWVTFMKTRSFCFGTRIHGTVASIVAGTPATLIAHDSRTREMAESMSIPFVTPLDILKDSNINLDKLLSLDKIHNMNNKFGNYYGNYIRFLQENRLSVADNYTIGQ